MLRHPGSRGSRYSLHIFMQSLPRSSDPSAYTGENTWIWPCFTGFGSVLRFSGLICGEEFNFAKWRVSQPSPASSFFKSPNVTVGGGMFSGPYVVSTWDSGAEIVSLKSDKHCSDKKGKKGNIKNGTYFQRQLTPGCKNGAVTTLTKWGAPSLCHKCT